MSERAGWRWFRYDGIDAKAIQAELDRLAAAGLELMELGIFCARFEQRPSAAPPCRVELRQPKWSQAQEQELLARRADAGWTLLDRADGLLYLKATSTDVPPLPEMEPADLWRKWLRGRSAGINGVLQFFVVSCTVACLREGRNAWRLLFSGPALFTGFCVVLILAWEVIYVTHGIRYRRRCARTAVGETCPVPDRRSALVRGAAPWAGLVLIAAVFVVALANVTGTQRADGFYIARNASVIAQSVEYTAVQDGYRLGLSEYDCGLSPLADLVESSLLRAEAEEDDFETDRLHFHGALAMEPAELGFDAAWIGEIGEGWQCLIIRDGKRVVWVEAPADFRDPDRIGQLVERIRDGV